MTGAPLISLSAIDEERWGVRTARAWGITADHLPDVLAFCRREKVVFLVARCAVSDLRAAQMMEAQGFRLMDTLLYYSRDLTQPLPPVPDSVRPACDGEADAVRMLAGRAFRAYNGHYHADERLDRAACDAVYESWAYRSCLSRQVADEVLVAAPDGQIAGFITLRLNGAQGEGPLYAVDPAAQGQGIGRALMTGALHWLKQRGARDMLMSTQVTNVPSQKVWTRLGFEPSHAEYTFHKWFDE
ncbi:MAG: GNAT family N-acetyltransferase [Chloroflexi bacterium]|nr:GNAT family N-acetyltransferase [Chloroflexota bacterium]